MAIPVQSHVNLNNKQRVCGRSLNRSLHEGINNISNVDSQWKCKDIGLHVTLGGKGLKLKLK